MADPDLYRDLPLRRGAVDFVRLIAAEVTEFQSSWAEVNQG